jgi:hypothetical protein
MSFGECLIVLAIMCVWFELHIMNARKEEKT